MAYHYAVDVAALLRDVHAFEGGLQLGTVKRLGAEARIVVPDDLSSVRVGVTLVGVTLCIEPKAAVRLLFRGHPQVADHGGHKTFYA